MIHLIFVFCVRYGSKFIFCIGISSYSNTLSWKDTFATKLPLHFCQKSIACMSVGLFLESLFYSTDVWGVQLPAKILCVIIQAQP